MQEIADVDGRFVGEPVADFTEDGEATDSGVEDSYRAIVTGHGLKVSLPGSGPVAGQARELRR
jgi:hypothetical protein